MISIFDVASTNNNLLSGGNIQYQVSCWWCPQSQTTDLHGEYIIEIVYHWGSTMFAFTQQPNITYSVQSLWNLHLHLLYVNRNLKRKMQSKSKCLRRESKLLTSGIYVRCSWYCKTLGIWQRITVLLFELPHYYSFHLV